MLMFWIDRASRATWDREEPRSWVSMERLKFQIFFALVLNEVLGNLISKSCIAREITLRDLLNNSTTDFTCKVWSITFTASQAEYLGPRTSHGVYR